MIGWTEQNGVNVASLTISDRTLLRTTWGLLLSTALISMTIHHSTGHSRAFPFFISESDYPGLERYVFTIGFTTAGALLALLSLRMSHTLSGVAKPSYSRTTKGLGFSTGACLALLSWFNMHDEIFIHSLFATIAFIGSYCWSYTTHLALSDTKGSGHNIRKVWLVIGAGAFAVMNLSLMQPVKEYIIEGGIRDGRTIMNLSQSAIQIAAIAEYVLFISLVVMLASFENDLASVQNAKEN
jgi:hypothetical protein